MAQLWSVVWGFVLMLFVENAAITIPIVISVLAVLISIATARKQNAIALFELRYRCLSQIKTVLSFESSIYDCDEAIIIMCLFDAFWGTDVSNKGFDEKLIRTKGQLELIKHDVLQAEFLFGYKYKDSLGELIKALHAVVIDAVDGEIHKEKQEELHKKCELFYRVDFPVITKKTKL